MLFSKSRNQNLFCRQCLGEPCGSGAGPLGGKEHFEGRMSLVGDLCVGVSQG
jgi:hypothetical protein